MILIHGQIRENREQGEIIKNLEGDLIKTLSLPNPLTPGKVITACDSLAAKVLGGEYDAILLPLLKNFNISRERFTSFARQFTREGLERKFRIELGDAEGEVAGEGVVKKRRPLGVLLHIAAGNLDGLPAFSVVEGLLAGNINILKLPAGDSGLSVRLLSELIAAEPDLADYIYVFDVPSTETATLTALADLSDGVVVWGGDAAVRAARELAGVTTKIIEWGHKLSFAYATPDAPDRELEGLALHICETEQTLCSSCQGIFIDTESEEEQLIFAARFFEILKRVNREFGPADFGMRAKSAINLYNERLERHFTGNTIFSGEGVGVIAAGDRELCLSFMFRNVWVKRLPSGDIIRALKKHKSHLKTAGLICPDAARRAELAALLERAGLVRITSGSEMSRTFPGEAHDGVYALREYSRIVEIDGRLN